MSGTIEIPRYLDSLPQFLWWELDELIVLIGLFAGGIAIGELIYVIVLGILPAMFYLGKFKREALEGGIYHAAYSMGALPLNAIYGDVYEKDFYK